MRTFMTLVGCLVFFICGTQISVGQQTEQTSENAMKQTIIDNASAKKQTFDLHRIVNLNGDQTLQVHNVFLELDKKMKDLATMEEGKRVGQLNVLQNEKNEKLRTILTDSQYEIYLKSEHKK